MVQLVNASGHFGTSFYKQLPIVNAKLSIPLEKAPSQVRSLYKKDNVSYDYKNGALSLTVNLLEEYEGIVIE